METQNYIPLPVHPTALSDVDLAELHVIAPKLAEVSVRFAAWLGAFLEFEIARRNAEAIAAPIEPELPKLSPSKWTDRELCNAAVASYIGVKLMHDTPGAARLMDTAHFAIVNFMARRFGGVNHEHAAT